MTTALSEVYAETVERISEATARAVANELGRVEPDEGGRLQPSFALFVGKVADALEVGQRSALDAAAGYVRAAGAELGHRVTPAPTEGIVGFDPFGRTVGELAGAVPAKVYVALANGSTLAEALELGAVTADQIAVTVVRDAAREALARHIASSAAIRGWRWVSRGTCAACMGADDGSENEPGPMRVHPNCRCIAEPAVEPPPAREVGAEWGSETWLSNPTSYMPEGVSRDLEAVWRQMTSSLTHYQELGFEDVNGFLRSGGDVIPFNLEELAARLRALRADPFLLEDAGLSERLSGTIRAIDHALELQAVPETVATYRGVGMDAFRAVLDALDAGDDLSKLVGSTIRDKGFLSTSLGESSVPGFAVQMRMTVEAGTPAYYMGGIKGVAGGQALGGVEAELLLGRGLELRILSAERRGGQWFLEVYVRRPR